MNTPEVPRRALLIQLRRLGDVILTAGLLADLRRAYPRAQIDFLTGVSAEPLLRHHPLLSHLLVYDSERPLRMALDIRQREYDWVIDVQSNPRTAMLTRASGARVRVGWDIGFWSWVYTATLPRSGGKTVYVLRERQRLLEMLGVPIGAPTTRLQVTAAERSSAEDLLRAAGAPPDAPRVAFVLSVTEPIRQWPVQSFAKLASELAAEGVVPIVLKNPGDETKTARLHSLCPAVLIAETTDLRMLLAAIASCAVLVSGDSGPAHMATALGIPRVTIYGPTDPAAWNPGLPTTIIVRDPAASVMRTRDWAAAGEHEGIVRVPADQVLARVRELLRVTGAPSVLNTGK